MHEWALAEGVVRTAIEEARKHGMTEIERVTVGIGELQQIKREVFELAIREVLPSDRPELARTEFELTIEPASFHCRKCGEDFDFAVLRETLGADEGEGIHFVPELAHAFVDCPACGSPDFEVRGGRGVFIREIVGPDAEESP